MLAGGVDVQRIASELSDAQLRGAGYVQRLEQQEESVAQRRNRARAQLDAALREQPPTDLLALLPFEVAAEANVHEQIVAVALAGLDQSAQRFGARRRA